MMTQTLQYEIWQIFYVGLLLSSICVMVASLFMMYSRSSSIRHLPKLITLISGTGVLLIAGMPYTLLFQIWLGTSVMMATGSPLSASIIIILVVLSSWFALFCSITQPFFKKK